MTTRREFTQTVLGASAALAVTGCGVTEDRPVRGQQAVPLQGHFHPKGKAPSEFTKAILEKAVDTAGRGESR